MLAQAVRSDEMCAAQRKAEQRKVGKNEGKRTDARLDVLEVPHGVRKEYTMSG